MTQLPFTIQIPVYNETTALAFSNFYFERLGLRPRYVLDVQRTPEAERMLTRLGHEPIYFENDRPFIENGYADFARSAPSDWILRLDCDEAPSPALIAFCREFVAQDNHAVAGFERHQVIWRDGGFLTATTERFSPAAQRQWRLFNRQRVAFDPGIHTPGLVLQHTIAGPPDAAIYHLAWVFLSWEDRVSKAARYDAHGQPSGNRDNQLFPIADVDWKPLDAPFLTRAYDDWVDGRGHR